MFSESDRRLIGEWMRRLPPGGPEYGRGFIGGRAAIVLEGTRTIVDIFAPI